VSQLDEEHRMGYWVLRGIFRIRLEEVIRKWRKTHNEELHNLYSESNLFLFKSMGMQGARNETNKCTHNYSPKTLEDKQWMDDFLPLLLK
jgi:hypothetical protein